MIHFDSLAQKVLSREQQQLLPLLEEFSTTHFLVGGTAIALQLGHRASIDFDLFRLDTQGSGVDLAKRISKTELTLDAGSDLAYLSKEEQPDVTLWIHGVKVQLIDFSRNPFDVTVTIPHEHVICGGIPTPTLLDLAAMKAFAMMYRKKWKDAVDLYFIMLEKKYTLTEIITRTKELFGTLYQELATLETILENTWDTTEQVEYLIPNPPTDTTITEYLIHAATESIKPL